MLSSCIFAPESFREAPGRKAVSILCVSPCKILHHVLPRELPGGSWEEGNANIMCKSFVNSFIKVVFVPGSFREAPGRKAMSQVDVTPF